MAILLISAMGPYPSWLEQLRAALPDEDVHAAGDAWEPAEIDVAVMARPDPAVLSRLKHLKLVIALRAGVDDALAVEALDPAVPIARAQEPDGDKMIDEYVLMHVLRHHREQYLFEAAQARGEWISRPVKFAEERPVGFLGLGVVGLSAAQRVRDLGFPVAAWTRTAKDEPGIESFHGPDGLRPFLARCEILVNVLAVTPETIDIVDARTLAALPAGASIINIGRGEHVVDEDLIAALDNGHIAHATLDVFRTEPLPVDHPFWRHPKITLMPHTSRRPRAARIIPQVAENIRRLRAGQPLIQPVDRQRGY